MARLLAAAPDDELDNRFPGRVTMTIGDAGLAHADELVAIVGTTPEELGKVRSAAVVRGFGGLSSGFIYFAFIRIFLVLGAILLVAPILVFIGMATRIAAAHREQRLAAIRLVGATQTQTALVAVVENGVAVLAGIGFGWAAYELVRRALLATVTVQGGHFYLDDAVAAPAVLAAAAAGVLALTFLSTLVSLRRVQLGPLGIVRRSRRSSPGTRRIAPLIVGFAGLVGVVPVCGAVARLLGKPLEEVTVLLIVAFYLLPAFLLTTLIGLLLTGPWLCARAGELMARFSRRAPGMIAARRLTADPRAAFRAVSGVVIAAFALTYFATLIGDDEPAAPARLDGERPGVVTVFTGAVPPEVVASLLTPDVVGVRFRSERRGLEEDWDWLVPCRDAKRVKLISCPYDPGLGLEEPAGPVDHLPVGYLYIPTDGSAAAQERVRTLAAVAVPNAIINVDGDRTFSEEENVYPDLFRILRIFCLVVLLVAAVSLSAGMVGALIERQRPFALLRAGGVPLSQLRRVLLLETAVPMVATSVLGVALGLLAANANIPAQDWAWQWPDRASLAVIGGGILVALLAPLPVLPLLNAATRPDAVRYE
jgi:hypothetical protein